MITIRPWRSGSGARRTRAWLGVAAFCAVALAGCAPVDPAGEEPPSQSNRIIVDGERPCFHPERGDFDTSCLTREQLAALLSDYDRDGRSNLDELKLGTDPYNASDGPDIDGDGVPNGEDPDVDGDGVSNEHDFDVDGDMIFNGHDHDIDADGLLNEDDPDADGDGLSDRFDLDDDGDDEPDDEEDEDEKPKDKLEDLIDRLKRGELTEQDKNDIANEIVKRLDSTQDKTRIQAILVDVVQQAVDPDRDQPPTTVPPGIAGIDAVYRQLVDSLAYVKSQQDDPKAPLDKQKLQNVLTDFVARADAIPRIARAYEGASIDQVSTAVSTLRNAVGPTRFGDVARGIGALATTPDDGHDRRQLQQVVDSVSRIAQKFPEASGTDLVDAFERLRNLLPDGASPTLRNWALDRLLGRLDEIADGDLPATLDDALDQIEREENPPPPSSQPAP